MLARFAASLMSALLVVGAAAPAQQIPRARSAPLVVLDDFNRGTAFRATACPLGAAATPKDCMSNDETVSRAAKTGTGMVFSRRTFRATTDSGAGAHLRQQRAMVRLRHNDSRDRVMFIAEDPRQGTDEDHSGYFFDLYLTYGDSEGIDTLNLPLLDLADGKLSSRIRILIGQSTNFGGKLYLTLYTRVDQTAATVPVTQSKRFKPNKRQLLTFRLDAFKSANDDLNDVDYIEIRIEGYTDNNARNAGGTGIYQNYGVETAQVELRRISLHQPKKS